MRRRRSRSSSGGECGHEGLFGDAGKFGIGFWWSRKPLKTKSRFPSSSYFLSWSGGWFKLQWEMGPFSWGITHHAWLQGFFLSWSALSTGGPCQDYLCHVGEAGHFGSPKMFICGHRTTFWFLVEQKASKTQPPTNGSLFFILLELVWKWKVGVANILGGW